MKSAFWSKDHILISKAYNNPIPHRHLAKHLIFSMDDPFECRIENINFYCKAVCIDSNALHTVNHDSGQLLVFLFDETSNPARKIDEKYLMGAPYCLLSEELIAETCNAWRNNGDDAKSMDAAILSICNLQKDVIETYDDRVCRILKQIAEMEGIYEGTVETLCDSVYLSRSRVSHLFKEQVGVSLSSYLVFEKMRKAYTYIASGHNVTDACIKAGFSSSSHFSNVCKKMFGLTITEFIKTTVSREIK